jgi:hypothetical protein
MQNYYDTYTPGSTAGMAVHFVLRNCSIYGSWLSEPSHSNGLYCYNYRYITVEDCIFVRNGLGWSETRDVGATIFDHNIYIDNENADAIVRRTVTCDAASHGAQVRCGGIYEDNVHIGNPINCLFGGGDQYNQHQPSGITGKFRRNVAIESNNINSTNPRGYFYWFANTNPAIDVNRNIAMRETQGLVNARAWTAEAAQNQPTSVTLRNNISHNLQRKGNWLTSGAFVATQVFVTSENNQWDATASGTNQDSAVVTYPDPNRTVGGFYATLGGSPATQAAFLDHIKDKPGDRRWSARAIRNYFFAGFGW